MSEDHRLQYQRDLYRLLLDLQRASSVDVKASLECALPLLMNISGADRGYLEVQRSNGTRIFTAHSLSDEEVGGIQKGISTGIIAETLRSGEAVVTQSALFDPRFHTLESVQQAQIQTVVCVPLKGGETQGVLYLQGDFESGDESIRLDTASFQRQVSPLLDQLLIDTDSIRTRPSLQALREKFALDDIIGHSSAIHEVLRLAMMVAPLPANVLLTGSSGTGKNQLARVIHDNSGRHSAPFIEVNCGALPETLLESELFGAVKGAHSTATADMEGKVAAARGGTLFLDEISSLPLAVQGKLLQFLQSGQYFPLGSTRLETSDARLVFASNIDLERAVATGEFRADLYFRINMFPIALPDLKDRPEDIAEIAISLCDRVCRKYGFPTMSISPDAMEQMTRHSWPGNVRELSHCIETACIKVSFEGQEQIGADDLGLPVSAEPGSGNEIRSFHEATQAFQAEFLRRTLARVGGNVSEAARQLEVSRSHLHHLIRSLGIRDGEP